VLILFTSAGTSVGLGRGERAHLRIAGLSEVDAGGVHARGAKREASAARGCSGVVLRAASAATCHCRNADGCGGGRRAGAAIGGSGTGSRGRRRRVRVRARAGTERHVARSGEGESGAALGHG